MTVDNYLNFIQMCRSSAPGDFSFIGWFGDKVAGPLVAGLALAFIGSLIITRANERYKGHRDHTTKSVDALRTQVEAVVKLAAEYWNSGPDETSRAKESEIEYRLADINSLTRICGDDLWPNDPAKSINLIANLIGAVVTDKFAASHRVADRRQASIVVNAAVELTEAVNASRMAYFHKSKR